MDDSNRALAISVPPRLLPSTGQHFSKLKAKTGQQYFVSIPAIANPWIRGSSYSPAIQDFPLFAIVVFLSAVIAGTGY
jgi:hypothetical protein